MGIRIRLRAGEADAAAAAAAAVLESDASDELARVLLGIATYRRGHVIDGRRLLEDAYRAASASGIRAEAAYHLAWAEYIERRLDEADRWVAAALLEAHDVLAARTVALSGWIFEARGEFAAASRMFRRALHLARTASESDAHLASALVHSLAVFAAELPDAKLAAFVRSHVDDLPRALSAHEHRFQTTVHLGLASANDGDVAAALDAFDEAASILGVNRTLRAAASVEQADLYRLAGEPVAARRAMVRAAAGLKRLPAGTGIEEQMVLLDFACVCARLDPSLAAKWLTRYCALAKHDEGRFALTRDRRIEALELHARGIVEAALGVRERGVEHLRAASALWEALAYRRRAAYAAADVMQFGEGGGVRLSALLASMPKHPLAALVRAGGSRAASG